MRQVRIAFVMSIVLATVLLLSGCSAPQALQSAPAKGFSAIDSVKAGKFDTGKMWTFDFPPVEYFASTYHFNPTKEWFDKVRLSAVRIPGCSAAFVSEDGLFMTNHHCSRSSLQRVQKEGEKLVEVGFYAPALADERKTAIYVDQLVVMDDVTKEIQAAFDRGTTDSARSAMRTAAISDVQKRYSAKYHETSKDSMVFSVLAFYNGGRYSLYGYKRYTDVRLVFAPEEKSAFFGGDPDNFTYPRYDFDCAFFRVYDDGKPLKTSNFFKFSATGPEEGEPVFVIGNPGTTNRLMTLAQLETLRDYQYPASIDANASRKHVLNSFVEQHPDKKLEYLNTIFGIENSLKAQTGYLGGLQDPYLMAKKVDFEANFKRAVAENPTLQTKYGDPWKQIADFEGQRRALMNESNALSTGNTRSQLMNIAGRLVDRARGGADPRAGGMPGGPGGPGGFGRGPIFPANFVLEIEKPLLADQLTFMKKRLGNQNASFNALLAGQTPEQAAARIAGMTSLSNKDSVEALSKAKADDVLASVDPLIKFVAETRPRATELQAKLADIRDREAVPAQSLGRAMYEVFGTSIPPDATFSLRIADGIVKGYNYNGTYAPSFTTFYGLYDRYYSFGKSSPWLPGEKWIPAPADLNLSTPMNFCSTNDAIGGNSGSSVINRKLEVVGLLFDGNIESLPGNIIYDETYNRSVNVHTAGILEGLQKVYKAGRLADELRKGAMIAGQSEEKKSEGTTK
jgi:hypothetical protein